MNRSFLQVGILLTALAVMLGAFGAHSLRPLLKETELLTYETAVRYQFYHSFAVIITGILFKEYNRKYLRLAGYSLYLGLLIFCGSLYALTGMRLLKKEGFEWLGAITPLGGILFVVGWVFLLISVSKKSQSESL